MTTETITTITVVDENAVDVHVDSTDVQVVPVPVPPINVVAASVGLPGPEGPPGTGSAVLRFNVTVASGTWTIPHNLGRWVVVQVLDDAGVEIDADVEQPDLNTAVVTFASPATGSVLIV